MKTVVIAMMASLLTFTGGNKIGNYKTDNAKSTMKILGTSSLHDWEMAAQNMEGVMNVDIYDNSIDIKDLKLTVTVASLKSGKSTMDKNAYAALKEGSHPKIHYDLRSVKSITPKGNGKYSLLSTGALTIAGKTKQMSIPLEAQMINNTLELRGATTFKMSEFGVEPPSVMFGRITTGDEITIKFNINYRS